MDKKLLILIPLALAALAAGVWLAQTRYAPQAPAATAVSALWQLSFPDVQGQPQALAQWRGLREGTKVGNGKKRRLVRDACATLSLFGSGSSRDDGDGNLETLVLISRASQIGVPERSAIVLSRLGIP